VLTKMNRRRFLQQLSCGVVGYTFVVPAVAAPQQMGGEQPQRLPYKIGIRQASLRNPRDASKSMVGDLDIFKVARDIPGIIGVELQVASGRPNMRDLAVARDYKAQAYRWGLSVPSTAGVWSSKPWSPDAESELLNSIRATEILGARVMLVAFFGETAPDMTSEASYGPVVSILRKVAPHAEEAGVILGLENSLSPKENRELVDRVGHRAVKVYYDLDNMYHYGHGDQAVAGVELLGLDRIAAVHVKNKGRILKEKWRIDWAAAFQALNEIRYDGWLIFETAHKSHQQCKEMTRDNITFIKEHFHPPVA